MAELDVRLVRIFVAVADERSFTRAAERLHVAQPWLSVQVRKLEEQLGFRLFERNRNQAVVISHEADAFLPAARDYLQAVERVTGRARRIRDSRGSLLRVGAPDFTAEMPMRNSVLDGFAAMRRDIDLEVSNAFTVELLKRLRAGEIDVAFTVGPHVEPSCEAMVIARYRLSLLARAGDFPDQARVPLTALAGREVAIFRRNVNAPFHDSIAPTLEAAGVVVAYQSEASVPATVHNALRTGMLALVGSYIAPNVPEGLIVLPIEEPELWFNLNLVRRIGDRTPAVSGLWTCAMQMIAGSYENRLNKVDLAIRHA